MASFFLLPGDLCAFGPLTHLRYGEWILGVRACLPSYVGEAISASPLAYLLGSFLADLIVGKSFFVRDYEHSHTWETGFRLYERAGDREEASFMLGYLSHLAADTVAHNYFIPTFLLLNRRRWGHLYWEMVYDRYSLPAHAHRLRFLVNHPRSRSLRRFLEVHLKETLFSHPLNSLLFSSQLRFLGRYQGVRLRLEARRGELFLAPGFARHCDDLALRAIYSLLRDGFPSPVVALDPRGRKALSRARFLSRSLNPPSHPPIPLTLSEARKEFYLGVQTLLQEPLPSRSVAEGVKSRA